MDRQLPLRHRTARTSVKSGCRTCKIRKVKCDEGRPACHRCASTGRACDGYGIWGGGDSQPRTSVSPPNSSLVRQPPVSALASTPTENRYFEWFGCRASTKLPGSYQSSFWNKLILQASLSEPAVLHAVLAMSQIHMKETLSIEGPFAVSHSLQEQREFPLQHYVKAIGYLKPHFTSQYKSSSRVVLITCLVFVALDLLRSHFEEAQNHLRNGLKILDAISTGGIEQGLPLKPDHGSTDDLIIQAYSRLYLQVELFHYTHAHPRLVLPVARPYSMLLEFNSYNDAWKNLQELLDDIFHLTHQSRGWAASSGCSPHDFDTLRDQQRRIQAELFQWADTYETFNKLFVHRSVDEAKMFPLIYSYHTLATLMANTCLLPDDEMVFDAQTELFALAVRQLTILWDTNPSRVLSGYKVDMPRTIIDVGWIPPLYYVAVKCRVHKIRLDAITLLESASHREGIWDSITTSSVARKVMEIEEADFFRDIDAADDFALGSNLLQDLLLPPLPESHRIHEVEMVLSGAPMDKVVLLGKLKNTRGDKTILSEYDMQSHRWTDRR